MVENFQEFLEQIPRRMGRISIGSVGLFLALPKTNYFYSTSTHILPLSPTMVLIAYFLTRLSLIRIINWLVFKGTKSMKMTTSPLQYPPPPTHHLSPPTKPKPLISLHSFSPTYALPNNPSPLGNNSPITTPLLIELPHFSRTLFWVLFVSFFTY